MIQLSELLTDCDARGIRFRRSAGSDLTIDAPQGALTPELIDQIKTHKAELLGILHSYGHDSRTAVAAPTDPSLAAMLARILPPLDWLTYKQLRLWRERTAAYIADGWPRQAAEQEAMAELVMTGKLYNPERSIPWPKQG